MRITATTLLITSMCLGIAAAEDDGEDKGPQVSVHRTNPHESAPTAGSTGVQAPSIAFHGGPVMANPNVYLIWYGNWNQSNGSDTPAGQSLVNDFLHGLSGSPYYAANASYYGSNSSVSGLFSVNGATTDRYSQGSSLSDRKVGSIVANAINSGALPKDANGIYLVLTSSDVSENSGFCSRYCGWHTYGFLGGTNIKYAFVGNANRCLNACAAQTIGPNGNAGVDGMVSVMAHELEETNTDPNLNAWYDAQGAEDADKCAWTFGQTLSQTSTGAYYNMTLPGVSGAPHSYLIQRELDVNSLCYVNYVTKTQ